MEAKVLPTRNGGPKGLRAQPHGVLLGIRAKISTFHEKRPVKCLHDMEEMGILDHLICLLRNLYAGQEATVRTGHVPGTSPG